MVPSAHSRGEKPLLRNADDKMSVDHRGVTPTLASVGGVTGAIGVPSDEAAAETPIPDADLVRVFGPGDYRKKSIAMPQRSSTSRLSEVLPMTSLVCAEEELDTPIFELGDDEFEELILTVTADSGAGNHITNRDDIGGYAKLIQPSPGSLAGKGFIAADNKKDPERGPSVAALAR